ncbi:filamentous hemagglutinin N-terminal domain-containing protein [Paraburkholderia sp. Se-20369]|nr:filamentous hemagglutinin N-terminal domain-containing protein [Paraburkholderia sp. Se-20369]
MNKTYALVWNHAQGSWTAVGETARRCGKSGGRKRLAATALSLLGLAALPAHALPTGEAVMSGKADIARTPDGKSMSINQHTDKLITHWQDFSVAGGERVSFNQPTSQSIALNRVIGNNGSQIDGQISANGRVFLVNPNGVLFGSGAQVNVGGLVASTQNLSDADFLAGNYRFAGASTQSVVNNGTITAADGGSVALLGARVSNNGVIQARLGRVAMGAGNAFNVNFDGNGLLSVQVDGGAVDAQASNGGLLKADGGEVLMTARAAGNLLDAVVNNTGTIEARGLSARGGRITLDGGTVKVGGKLDASAAEAGAPVGSVTTRGERVDIANDVQVDTRAGNAAGTWTIEAANAGVNGADTVVKTRGISGNITGIGGNVSGPGINIDIIGNGGTRVAEQSIGADTLSRSLGTTNVALTNTKGDLSVGGPVAWTSDNALTLTANNGNVNLKQAVSAAGANASLLVNAANQIRVNDAVRLTGRNAHLELNSKNGHTFANDKAVVTLSGDNASYRSNGEDYQVLHGADDLRNVDANLNGRYVLGNAIDGNDATFHSIGGDRAFGGVFDGLGNTISRLNISNPGKNVVGLFGVNTGTIANLGLQHITTTGTAQSHGSPLSIGVLAGYNAGTISNVAAKDVVVTANGRAHIGGLVGSNLGGTIDRASVSGRVDGDRETLAIGGLAGENVTVLEPNARTATIRNSQANVQVVAALDGAAGGLVGVNTGRIADSSSAGSVDATGEKSMVGGLVGVNAHTGIVTASSSSATVTARENAVAGGLVGANKGTVSASRATGAVSVGDAGIAGGLVGVNRGDIDDSTANGKVVAGVKAQAGGLVGLNGGAIHASTAKGDVTAGDSSWAGGLVGFNEALIDASTATGNVVAGADSVAGGLVGRNFDTGAIRASTARGDVKVAGKGTIGGLVGANEGAIDGSSAKGTVTADDESVAGGLAGTNAGSIVASSAAVNVIAGTASSAGGLVGENTGAIDSSDAKGSVTAGVASAAGGLVGVNTGVVKQSSAAGVVLAGLASEAGGLIGRNAGFVLQSGARGKVKAGNLSVAGGLVGANKGGTISQSRASGNVEAGPNSTVGGLVGNNGGTINASSSSGTVSGGRYAKLGGLVGANFGYVNDSSTRSRIVVTNGYDQVYGSLAGLNVGTLAGNSASGSGAGIPRVGVNYGVLK